jgi:hypothetical protein
MPWRIDFHPTPRAVPEEVDFACCGVVTPGAVLYLQVSMGRMAGNDPAE